jgi:hypothetical protein
MKRQKRGIELLVIVSDIHAGSSVAIMPPKLTIAEEQVVEANALQRFFWKAWLDAVQWVGNIADADQFALCLNGDMIEGNHHHTKQIISTEVGDHVECAAQVLAPLASKASKIFLTKGTECHTGDAENALGLRLNAEKNPANNRRVFDRLTLDICGTRFVARHHVSTSSRPWADSNGLGVELASEQLQAIRNGEPLPKILAVAHRHVGGHIANGEGICLATPAWQGLTRHGHKVVGAARCKPGLYILDWRGLPDGELPRIHRRIYEAPHAQVIAI